MADFTAELQRKEQQQTAQQKALQQAEEAEFAQKFAGLEKQLSDRLFEAAISFDEEIKLP
jgi:hypothetical protein